MRTFRKSHFRFTKMQRNGIFLLVMLIIFIEIIIQSDLLEAEKNSEIIEIPEELLAYQEELDNKESQKTLAKNQIKTFEIEAFNPNELSKESWIELGFSARQAEVILKYKKSLGGKFSSKEQIKSCFVIDEKKYESLKKFILLPEKENIKSEKTEEFKEKSSPKIKYSNFNPNELNKSDWMELGFSEKQAQTILNYKKSIGGEFKTKEQLKKCYGISEAKFKEIESFIDLPKAEKTEIAEESEKLELKQNTKTQEVINWTEFNPDKLSKEEWMNFGFTERQVATILNFKKSLGGSFKNEETLKKCYAISQMKFEEMKPYINFDLE